MYNIISSLLTPKLISRLDNLELLAMQIVEGFITGLHTSPFHGFSVEFSEHRPYMRGDDLRHVDWKVLARKERYFIKQYEEETNLRCQIILDISRSMAFSSGDHISKLNYSKVLTAALTYILLRQRDAVGLFLFSDKVHKRYPAKSLPNYFYHLAAEIQKTEAGAPTMIGAVLHDIADRIHRRSLVILISDLLDDADVLLKGIRHLKHNQHEIIVFNITDPLEHRMDMKGQFLFRDMENPALKIKTDTKYIRREYEAAVKKHFDFIARKLQEMNVHYVPLTTANPIEKALTQYMLSRKKMY
ncbi:MAG TPA: DUF58 domain-containing protein [Caldithrix abyssi]|uniref:DUF58 domain-containing protein n=1 Tax=Caldithrix abyssi TaxID=187145 RepID=A0A7V1PW22_CALAY|nr:DUF58 domain-containing protein [Caldithrix abyssi]